MPQFDENHVKICGGTVVWDGITRPEVLAQGAKAGQPKWNIKCLFNPQNPDLVLFDALVQRKLLESKWRGQLPPGGRLPGSVVQPHEYNGQFTGWIAISFKTTLRVPDVYDETATLLDPMQYGQMIYGGQQVDILAHCYEYDAAGNKGIAAGIDAFSILISANAPRQDFGGGGVDTAGAFGGQPPQGQPPAGYPPQGQPPQGQPPAGYPPQGQPPVQGQPPAQDPGYPAQAHNFLPGQQ